MTIKNLVPGVSDDLKAGIVAYNLAHRRIQNPYQYRHNGGNLESDKFVLFTLGRNVKKANKLILNAMVTDILIEANILLIKDKCQSWEIISTDSKATEAKIWKWAEYLDAKDRRYITTEHNIQANNSLIKVNCYQRDNMPLLDMNSTFYGKDGSVIKSIDDKVAAVYQSGYLMHKRRTAGIVRPRGANRQDIEFVHRLIDFMSKGYDPNAGHNIHSEIRNSIRRFCANYLWPGKEQLESLLKTQFLRPK